MPIPDHLFAFASYQRLVNYRLQTPENIKEAQKKIEKNKREKLGREGPETGVEKILSLVRKEEKEEEGKAVVNRGEKAEEMKEGQKNTIRSWATEMEDDDEVEEEVSTGELMHETDEN
ncbi:hypothetical protein L873DRAFT_1798501 [Choiromyces venosus 120613-1]|uniref:Uncharacterized protein n=1 Tax=Choiromyces venosus 120613-1 TaxID=1336337 RepID=A0A3N4KGQ1_9PEZI|nr:hypothetical protein L873DRAFT_1798501 [Choiromyces venosus 120613-1]